MEDRTPRPLRSKLIEPNHLDSDLAGSIKNVINLIEDGIALLAEHDAQPLGLVVAQVRHETGVLEILDLRVDYDMRRQGIGSALLYEIIKLAREVEHRAIFARTLSNNLPVADFLLEIGL